jgi:glycosyltransferase involved in cell wall biosynthesis
MNILIDYTQIPIKRMGAGVYAYNLIKEISKLDVNNRYYLLIQNDDKAFDDYYSINLIPIKVKHRFFRNFLFRFFLEQIYIPYIIIIKKINIVHSLHYSFPLLCFNARRVVTIHDMTFFIMPEVHLKFKRIYFRLFIRLALTLKNSIICVSDSTKKDLLNLKKEVKNECTTIPLGKSEIFRNDYSLAEINVVKNKYNIHGNYILFIGTIEPRKNIETLIKSFYKFNKHVFNYELVIVGKKGWYYDNIFALIEELHIEDKIIFTGFILEEEKPILLNGSSMFVYPSLYEGFGIPVLEAMACGTPVITSNLSSLPEVAGNAAKLIDPKNIDELEAAMLNIVNDVDYAKKLAEKGIKQSKKFTWQNTALKTVEIYNNIKHESRTQ